MTSQNTHPCSAWLKLKVRVRAVCFFASPFHDALPPSLLHPHGHFEPSLTSLSAPTQTTTPTTLQSTSLLRSSFYPSQNRGTSAHITSGGESVYLDDTTHSTFGALVEYHPISTRDQMRIHQFGKKVLPGIFLRCVLIAVRIVERRYSDC